MSIEVVPSNMVQRDAHVFGRQQLLHTIKRDETAEKRALTYLDKHAPDLIGMIMGHLL